MQYEKGKEIKMAPKNEETLLEETKEITPEKNETPAEAETSEVEAKATMEENNEEDTADNDSISEQIDAAILALRRDSSRSGSRVEKMSKAKKKEMYHSEHVITEYGEEELVTESMEKKEEYTELVASQKSKKILKGKITGWRYANEDDQTSTILAEVSYGKGFFDILIPSYLLFDYDLNEKHATKEENDIIAQQITKRINSNVDFVVATIQNTGLVIADRLLALSLKGVNNYVGKNLDLPRVRSGLLVDGNIVLVSRTFVIVEALGAEIHVPQDELAYHHVGDAREEFNVGDKVIVRILSATPYKVSKYDNNYTLIDAKGSIKSAKPDRRKEHFDRFRIGGRYAAEVTYVEESVYVRLADKMDAMVAFPKFGKNPVRGDERIVEITGKDEDRLFIYGVFVNN